jgi:hypothetical protein
MILAVRSSQLANNALQFAHHHLTESRSLSACGTFHGKK